MTRRRLETQTAHGQVPLEVLFCDGIDCGRRVAEDAFAADSWLLLEPIGGGRPISDPFAARLHFHAPACVAAFIEANGEPPC